MKASKDDYTLSIAGPEDLFDLTRLVNSAYRGESSRQGWTTEADFLEGQRTDPDTLQKEIQKPTVSLLCLRLRAGGELHGCVFLQMFKDDRGPGCYLGMLTVKPDLQNTGLGRILLEISEDFARSKGARRMTLGVIQLRGPLLNWYERRGYLKTGKNEAFPYGDKKAGIPRRDDLHFVMFEKVLD